MHTQILHFKGGIKRTIENVIKVYENEMCHILTLEGIEWIVNKNNLLMVERLPDKMSVDWKNQEKRVVTKRRGVKI